MGSYRKIEEHEGQHYRRQRAIAHKGPDVCEGCCFVDPERPQHIAGLYCCKPPELPHCGGTKYEHIYKEMDPLHMELQKAKELTNESNN